MSSGWIVYEYILHPVESWLRMGEMDGAEATVEVEVEASGNVRGPPGMEGGGA